jgi:hypothetical protein
MAVSEVPLDSCFRSDRLLSRFKPSLQAAEVRNQALHAVNEKGLPYSSRI